MLETELNDSQQNETARGSDSDGSAEPSGLTGTASTGDAATAAGSDPAGGGESASPQRRTRRPRRAATRAAGPPAEDVVQAPVPPATPAVAPAPAETPMVPPASPGTSGSGSVPQATFQPPPVIFQPPAAGEPAADRGRVREEPVAEDTGPDEPSADGASDGTSRRRRRRGGRGRGHEADGETPGEDAEDGESAPSRGGREPGERGGRSAEAKQADGKAAQGKQSRGKQAESKQAQAEGKPGGPEDADDRGDDDEDGDDSGGTRRRRRRRRRGASADGEPAADDPPNTVVHVRVPRPQGSDEPVSVSDVRSVRGSTRLEAKRQRRREGRESGRRRPPVITEAEFLARREAVDRVMVVRQQNDRTQIAVLEDGVLVEHYVDNNTHQSMVGNVYLGKVQNVLPSMEAAFVDVGKGRNAVLYAGEVNFDASGLEGDSKRIESALKSGQAVLVQVTKDPVGHKGARLTSQVSLPGRYLVYVPGGSMMGISRKLPDKERTRLKQILKQVMPDGAGVIVRTAAEGATEEELSRDVARLAAQWEAIEQKSKTANAPDLLYSEPDLTIRVVRDIFNEDFESLVVAGDEGWDLVHEYVQYVAPHLAERLTHWTDDDEDVFGRYRIDEQLAKALERKVWLPSGGSLVIDNTEAMTVIDVNTGKFTGQGGNLEETVTRNNLEAAEEIVRQLRLRDVGGIIVIDFIDMVLESNRELVLRRMLECLARDRTKHQVAEVTSLGLVQMTRKRVGAGLLEAFSEPCDCCNGRGRIISADLTEPAGTGQRGRSGGDDGRQSGGGRQDRNGRADRNGQDRNGRSDRNGQEKNGQDKSGQDKSGRGGRNGQQDRHGQEDRPAADHDAAGAPDGGEAAASEPAAGLLVATPGERQGGRRRRRAATRPAGAPDALPESGPIPAAVAAADTAPAEAAPDAGPAGDAVIPVEAQAAEAALPAETAPATDTVPATQAAPATEAVAGPDEVPAAETGPMGETWPAMQTGPSAEAGPAGEALTAAEAASAVSPWPAGDAPAPAEVPPGPDVTPEPYSAPGFGSGPMGESSPAPGIGSQPADGDTRPADGDGQPAGGGSHPADQGSAAADEEHPPF